MIHVTVHPTTVTVGHTNVTLEFVNRGTGTCTGIQFELQSEERQLRVLGSPYVSIARLKAGESFGRSLELRAEEEGDFVLSSTIFSYQDPTGDLIRCKKEFLVIAVAAPPLENELFEDERIPQSDDSSESDEVEQTDQWTQYELGLARLLNRIESQEALEWGLYACEQQLKENIFEARRYRDTAALKHERSRIVDQLNRIALNTVGTSFNDLCT